MADDLLYRIVYPQSAPGLPIKVDADGTTLRSIADKISPMAVRLTLASPPKEDLAHLSQQASPYRFERADIAARFLAERPERGDARLWQEATEKDAALGELVVLLDPFIEWTEQALAVTLAELSGLTGRIERTVDRLDQDKDALGDTSAFHVADLERERIEQTLATTRKRIEEHLERGAQAVQRSAQKDLQDVAARRLKGADPERIIGTDKALKLKKKTEE